MPYMQEHSNFSFDWNNIIYEYKKVASMAMDQVNPSPTAKLTVGYNKKCYYNDWNSYNNMLLQALLQVFEIYFYILANQNQVAIGSSKYFFHSSPIELTKYI